MAAAASALRETTRSEWPISFGRERWPRGYPELSLVQEHPAHQAALSASAADPGLQRLLPDADGIDPFLITIDGGFRMMQGTLPYALIRWAASELLLLGIDLTPDALGERVVAGLELVRKAVAGQSVPITRLIAYAGFPLATGQTIATPWGRLLPANVPEWLQVRRQDEGATAVLVSGAEERLWIHHSVEPERTPAEREAMLAEAKRRYRIATYLTPLALVLGTAGRTSPVAPRPLWEMMLRPWEASYAARGWMLPPPPFGQATPLAPEELDEIARWSHLLGAHDDESLELAGRRIVSAHSQRWTLDDVLVDSVIGWESLVGGRTDTSFRTTAAMACLLAPLRGERRIDVHERLKAVYKARSDVVHGNAHTQQWSVAKGEPRVGMDVIAAAALDAAVRAFRALLEERADLIALSAHARSQRLLLGVDEGV